MRTVSGCCWGHDVLHFVSASTYDPNGFVAIDTLDDQSTGEMRRRVTRIATLDGSAAVNDFGFSDADRTIDLRWSSTDQATDAAVAYLMRYHSQVHVATRDGVFLAAPETYTPGAAESQLRLLVIEKASE